ncbi:FAD-dependent monooxygenase [Rhizobium sp. C1]|uniref:FAD-dependent monooxygenase n=1 Tax=Rhizobium sp. C1 TaxID=1349799 RepID=UPI001E433275|nr:FAD-dependent monooxygenase [Rhizobium sp. C1]MCD2176934.1 FAD-dependent monooxygenase [Rhizobium sp. C1]
MTVQSAIVVGAGVAGLTAALSLAESGISVAVLEQSAQMSEVGAGLQISANGARVLDRLGVLSLFSSRWLQPESVTLASGATLSDLATVPLGRIGTERWGAPYGVLHRTTLQQALLQKVEDHPRISLKLGTRIERPSRQALYEEVGMRADLLVGADGVWSKMRALVPGAGQAKFSGFAAWRFVIPEKDAPAFIQRNRVTAFTGPDAHIVCYPLKEVGAINLVAISAGEDPGHAWSISPTEEQRRAFVGRALAGWNSRLCDLLLTAPTPTWWPLFGVSEGHWTDNRDVVLIGDAAHAMLPFAAQGAVMAIEDAYDLAAMVKSMPVGAALVRYEAMRRARVAKVRARGDFNRFAYHARGPIRLARDAVFALSPATRLAAKLDWIYGYKAGEQPA